MGEPAHEGRRAERLLAGLVMGPTCAECDNRYPAEAAHESCAEIRIHAECDPSAPGWPL
jgi:hypothetical protein